MLTIITVLIPQISKRDDIVMADILQVPVCRRRNTSLSFLFSSITTEPLSSTAIRTASQITDISCHSSINLGVPPHTFKDKNKCFSGFCGISFPVFAANNRHEILIVRFVILIFRQDEI